MKKLLLIVLALGITQANAAPTYTYMCKDHGRKLPVKIDETKNMPIPRKPPLGSDLITPPDSKMISVPEAGALLALIVVIWLRWESSFLQLGPA